MPFFNWDEGTVVVRNGFKIDWTIAIPLTIIVLLLLVVSMLLPWNRWLRRWRRGLDPEEIEL